MQKYCIIHLINCTQEHKKFDFYKAVKVFIKEWTSSLLHSLSKDLCMEFVKSLSVVFVVEGLGEFERYCEGKFCGRIRGRISIIILTNFQTQKNIVDAVLGYRYFHMRPLVISHFIRYMFPKYHVFIPCTNYYPQRLHAFYYLLCGWLFTSLMQALRIRHFELGWVFLQSFIIWNIFLVRWLKLLFRVEVTLKTMKNWY